jgi:ABC-2 type transport system permease protein
MWTLGVTVVVGIGISALATAETRSHWATMSPGARQGFDPTSTSLTALLFCQLAIGVLGVLVMSAEYGTGTIRATFSDAPRRPLVLAAKAAVFGAVALVVAEIVAFVSFLVGQALLSAPATHASLSTPGALRAVVGTGLYLGVIGLFALGLATIIRHTAGAISAFVSILLVLPIIVQALPNSLQDDIRRFLPLRIGAEMHLRGGSAGDRRRPPRPAGRLSQPERAYRVFRRRMVPRCGARIPPALRARWLPNFPEWRALVQRDPRAHCRYASDRPG